MASRRLFLKSFLAVPALTPIRALAQDMPADLALTPACGEAALTIRQTEGPYFTPDTPRKRDFTGDAPSGEPITIAGYVTDQQCKPVANALIELWHCDDHGAYDNSGYKLRGHQFSDAQGRWWFSTIVPGLYTGRTRHFHVKVQRPDGPVLTTQLYFPGEAGNARDRIFDESLLLKLTRASDGAYGRYDFVIA